MDQGEAIAAAPSRHYINEHGERQANEAARDQGKVKRARAKFQRLERELRSGHRRRHLNNRRVAGCDVETSERILDADVPLDVS